jgi:hypothetical protein
MGDVELAGARLAAELGCEHVAVALGEGARHHGGDLRILP